MEFINRVIHALTEVHPTHPMLVHFPIATQRRSISVYPAGSLEKEFLA